MGPASIRPIPVTGLPLRCRPSRRGPCGGGWGRSPASCHRGSPPPRWRWPPWKASPGFPSPSPFRAASQFKTISSRAAHQLLDDIPRRPSQPFSRAIAASNPLQTIRDHLLCGAPLHPATLAIIINSCNSSRAIAQTHALAVFLGLDSYLLVSNSMINAYSKSGSFLNARKLFDTAPNRDIVSWNTVLSSFPTGIEAMHFLSQMRAEVSFDAIAFTTALVFSADLQDLEFGQQLHSLISRTGFGADMFVGNALITAYSRSGFLDEATRVFDGMLFRDLVSWNALICGFTQEGTYGMDAIHLYLRMVSEQGMRPDHISFASVIPACGYEGLIGLGCQLHCSAIKIGFEACISVSNVLISMYYKCGALDCAKRVFQNANERNVVSWTSMISMDAENAVSLFNHMRLDGVQPNDVTFVALIFAMTSDHLLIEGQMIHGIIIKTGTFRELNVSSSLVTMYARLRCMENSRKIFDGMSERGIVTWNALISGYAQNELCEDALEIFSSLILEMKPNQYTFGSILSAITSAQTVSLMYGQMCHSHIMKLGLNTDEYVSGALIDMYAKHGSIDGSQKAFNETVRRSIISWTAMISAHSNHGNYQSVMNLFVDMLDSGITPDGVVFLAVLVACRCKEMVDTGRKIFDSMILEHKIEPWPEHYACMVDMLGRAGRLVEAEDLLKQIPTGPGVSALQSLLGACSVHGNTEMGKRVAKHLTDLEPAESGAYVLISNIYAEKGEWEHVARVRKGMRERGVKKEVGFSWVDVGIDDSLHMHKFSSDDTTHPLAEEIYRVTDSLGFEMKLLEKDIEMEMLIPVR